MGGDYEKLEAKSIHRDMHVGVYWFKSLERYGVRRHSTFTRTNTNQVPENS